MPTLPDLKHELETWLPDYTFAIKTGFTGSRIIVRHPNGHGASIRVKNDKIIVGATGPGLLIRLRLGTGGAYKKFADENYTETAEKVSNFLGRNYAVYLQR